MATDEQLNPTHYAKFSDDASSWGGPYHYVDMRGNLWVADWDMGSSSWSVFPWKDTYGMPAQKLAFFGEKPSMLIEAIEAKAEAWRIQEREKALIEEQKAALARNEPKPAPKSDGAGWLIALIALLMFGKGRRR